MSLIIRSALVAAVLAASVSPLAQGQSVAQQLASSSGDVDVIYPTRAGVCGDGRGSISHVLGDDMHFGSVTTGDYRNSYDRPCIAGPARVAATIDNGQVTRLRVYVGPTPASTSSTRTLNVSAAEATTWLSGVIEHGEGRIASDAIVALLVADAPEPWPLLLRVARDEDRSRSTRSAALFWLGNGANAKLGLSRDHDASDEDQVREQVVFALSQRPKSESVPELMDLARHGKYPSVRRSAIFWLGQTGDPRAADVYADLLGVH